jgi:hypothetical protein
VRRQGGLNAVTVEERYAPELPSVELDVSRIKQVFLNIINNAVYVMPNGGSLTIRTEAVEGGVRISFQDTGPRIAAEHVDRIFDPFFTTKPEVSGTGLGLSVSLGIVQSHGGNNRGRDADRTRVHVHGGAPAATRGCRERSALDERSGDTPPAQQRRLGSERDIAQRSFPSRTRVVPLSRNAFTKRAGAERETMRGAIPPATTTPRRPGS